METSYPEVSEGILKNFASITGKKTVLESLFNNFSGRSRLRTLNKPLKHSYFLVNFV